jgi:hypothetical protein
MLSDYNFNLNPYYDDFDETKNFYRILFKPGFAVQARELTQLQTQLQDQISKFGDHIFREGSVVLGGNTFYNDVNYIRVTRNNALTNFDGQIFEGQTSGARGKVVKTVAVSDTIAKIYFSYQTGTLFQKNELVVCDGNNNTETIENTDTFTGSATAFSIDSGVFYIYGNFVYCASQTTIIAEDASATCRIGLLAEETIKTQNQDTSLLDPALGSYNYSAPGADRYAITLTLTSFAYDPSIDTAEENASDNFIELSRFVNGQQVSVVRYPLYSELEDTLARRTFDESGDYTVRPFLLKVIDHVYGNTDLLSLQIDPGKAYVKGYEFETIAPTYLDLPKSRATSFENEFPLFVNYGKYFYIKNPSKASLDYTSSPTITLLNGTDTSTANVIGNCRVKYIEYDSQDTDNQSIYKLYVDNLNIFDPANNSTNNIVSLNTSTYQANIASNAYATSVTLEGNDSSSFIIRIPKDYVASVNSAELSYQTLTKIATNAQFIAGASTLDNTGVSNQIFLGSGLLSESDTRALFHVVAVSNPASDANISIGLPLDYDRHQLRITVTDEDTISMTTNVANSFEATVFSKVSISGAAQKSKTRQTGTVVISGASLTVANLSSSISLEKSDCVELLSVIAYSDTGTPYDYTSSYDFDTGQTDTLYDHGSIRLKPGFVDPLTANVAANLSSANVTVNFAYYSHSGTASGYFSVNSYIDNGISYESIPTYTSSTGAVFDLRNCIDFRPRRTDGATSITGKLLAEPSSIITTDFTHYLGRIDKLVLTKERKFTLIQGIPAIQPSTPVDMPDSMNLYVLTIPPYTKSKEEVTFSFVENKRYTMRDIGKIEKRVEKLEYYTALSLLEKQAKDESIVDVNMLDRFKNGILVDSFAGHSVGDVSHPDYSCSIDYVNRILRPRFSSYSYTFDVAHGSNYVKSGDLVTLNYSTETFINQPLASQTVNLNPYNVFLWNGVMTLDPPSDNWIDTTVKPDVIVNLNGENDVYTVLANNVSNPASSGVRWSDWKTVVNGTPQSTSQQSTSSAVSTTTANGKILQTTSTTTFNNQTTVVTDQLARVGLDIKTGAVQTVTRDLGSKIVDVSIAPFIRSRIVNFSAKSMKPSTELLATFDGVDVTSYCSPATEVIVGANNVNLNASSISLFTGNTNVSGTIISKRNDRIFIRETNRIANSRLRFETGNNIYWVVNGSVNTTPVIANTVRNYTSLTTNEKGDVAGFFSLPNNNFIRFRTGEREFKLADGIERNLTTAASTKYVAQGLSQSTQRTLVSTRVATVSINPVLDTKQVSTSSFSKTVVGTNTNTVDITPPPPPPPPPPPTVVCNSNVNGAGRQGTWEYTVEFGSNTGVCGISYDAKSIIPDRFTLIWDGNEYSTGFVGGTGYNTQLKARGFPEVVGPRTGSLTFNKTKSSPSKATLRIDAPFTGTEWSYRVICPAANIVPPTLTTTQSLTFTVDIPASIPFNASTFGGTAPATIEIPVMLRVKAAGTDARYIRVNNFNVVNAVYSSGGAAVTGFSFGSAQVDFDLSQTSQAIEKTGESKVILTVPRPAVSGRTGPYTFRVTATATLYTNIGRTTPSGLSDVDRPSNSSVVSRLDSPSGAIDPVAQTFFVEQNQYPNGIFLDSIDLYFKTKSLSSPVTVELRPTVNGYPSSKDIIPFSVVTLEPSQVQTTNDASVATNFKFESPIYLPPGEHCFVAKCNTDEYTIYTAVLGATQLTNPDLRITQQPAIGSMFKSQNSSTWTPFQEEDVMFKINKCLFNTGDANAATVTMNVDFPAAGNVVYDLLFVDGEHLDFAVTNIDYSYRAKALSDTANYTANTQYQLGDDTSMPERMILRSGSGSDLQLIGTLTTEDPNVSPVIDLKRLSTVLVQNIINNGELSSPNFLITDFGQGYTGNANVIITGTVLNPATGTQTAVSNAASALAVYDANTSRLDIQVTNNGSGYTGNVSAIVLRDGTASSNALVTVQNEIGTQGGNALARYITRKVTLAPSFESTDLKVFFLASIPTNTSVKVYYKAAPTGQSFDLQPWREMVVESAGAPSQTGFVDYKYKTYTENALPGDERFQTFSIKIVMYSSNPVRVPQIRDLRVIALDD